MGYARHIYGLSPVLSEAVTDAFTVLKGRREEEARNAAQEKLEVSWLGLILLFHLGPNEKDGALPPFLTA